MDANASLSNSSDGETCRLTARGVWTAPHAGVLERHLDELLSNLTPSRHALIDVSGVNELDTFGARALERVRAACIASADDVRVVGLQDRFAGLLQAVQRAAVGRTQVRARRASAADSVAAIGHALSLIHI